MQVQGTVQDRNGKTLATLMGKWNDSMYYVNGEYGGKGKGYESLPEAQILWKRSKPPKFPTRYNLTRFAITLNELTPGLKVCAFTRSFIVFPICVFSFYFLYLLFKRKICYVFHCHLLPHEKIVTCIRTGTF